MISSIIQIALALSVSPVDVCTVVSYETAGTMSPSIVNKHSGAVGLIQFMPETAKSLKTTSDKLAAMTFAEQSVYVIKYFKKRKFKAEHDGNDLKRLYSTVFCGNPNYKRCSNKTDGHNVFNDIISNQMKDHAVKCKKTLRT